MMRFKNYYKKFYPILLWIFIGLGSFVYFRIFIWRPSCDVVTNPLYQTLEFEFFVSGLLLAFSALVLLFTALVQKKYHNVLDPACTVILCTVSLLIFLNQILFECFFYNANLGNFMIPFQH